MPARRLGWRTLKFIPVRGRKRRAEDSKPRIYTVEIYPREGTETIIVFVILRFTNVEIYPREGTETF